MRRSFLVAFAIAAVVALLVTGEADAAKTLVYGTTSHETLSVVVPVKLVAGMQGTTTLSVNQTTATNAINLAKNPQDLSTLLGAKSFSSANGLVSLRFRNATSIANVASMTISLGGVTQVVIASGSVTRSTGAPVTLAPGATVTAAGTNMATTKNNVQAYVVFDVLTSPSTATGQSLNETWALDIS